MPETGPVAPRRTAPDVDANREGAVTLLKYLLEYTKLKEASPVHDVSRYGADGLLMWFCDLPKAPGLFCQAWTAPPEGQANTWLKVRKQELPPCPPLPSEVEPWVETAEVLRSGGPDPQLQSVAFLPVPIAESGGSEQENGSAKEDDAAERPTVWRHLLAGHPEVRSSWQRYLPGWREWSTEHARRAGVQQIYAKLYSAYQKQRRLGEAYELVVGLGLLTTSEAGKTAIRRHVITAQAQLAFEARRGEISLQCPPPTEGARLSIEDDFLGPDARPNPEDYKATEMQLASLGDAIWDRTQIDEILRSWTNLLPQSPGPRYSSELQPPQASTSDSRVTWAPAVILRRRTQRGTITLYQRLIAALNDGTQVPFGLARLVEHLDDSIPDLGNSEGGGPGGTASNHDPGEVFFPLRSNDQQQSIVRHLTRRRGVLVQGPPGTGKSHTIANLLCHLLATGKRVLVTSETARALAVLKEMIPSELRPLCVSLLGADQVSFSELAGAVSNISHQRSLWNDETRDARRKTISDRQQQLTDCRARRAEIQRTIRELHEAETYEVSIGDGSYRGSTCEIAKRVRAERPEFEWLGPEGGADPEPPLSNSDAIELLGLLREFHTRTANEGNKVLVDVKLLPSAPDFARFIKLEQEARERVEEFQPLLKDHALSGLFSAAPTLRRDLRDAVQRLQIGLDETLHRKESWLLEAVHDILVEHDRPWVTKAETTREDLADLRSKAGRVDQVRLTLPTDRGQDRILADAHVVIDHLQSGGRWSVLGFTPSRIKGREYLRKLVLIDGRPAASVDELRTLTMVLETKRKASTALELWHLPTPTGSGALLGVVAELDECLEAIDQALDLRRTARSVAQKLQSLSPPVPLPNWTAEGLSRLLSALDAVTAVDARREASAALDATVTMLEKQVHDPSAHPVNHQLLDAARRREPQVWAEACTFAGLLLERRRRLARLGTLSDRLSTGAAGLLSQLQSAPDKLEWEDKLKSLDRAWRWRRAERWLTDLRDPQTISDLEAESRKCDERERELVTRLAADKAWLHFLDRLDKRQQEHLEAWSFNIRKIGKGTGKGAEGFRAAARANMKVCVAAIPAWILPRYRVVDAFEASPNLFDVVIVDEASQTGIEGLFLYALADQVLIVGDDQQISPSDIGVRVDEVEALRRRFLATTPFPEALAPKVSLYDHAKIRFSGRVVLREHFRCVPEIIGFSDQLCYAPNGTPLVPLRNYEPARLEPILTRLVREGFQEGSASSAVNRPEAQALVSQIASCVKDPRYNGKSFGVISLLGEAQARLIERLLLSALGPELMEERKLVCGDAYAFQGDERSVVFLSMVSAPNARIGTLAGSEAFQRFNVAASRAQDQLWLFHSANLEDLSESCVRRRLLSYCLNPSNRDEVQDPRFDSGFERDVYERIKDKRYRVRTQVSAGDQTSHAYRIDLVIEGERARLAVECDGDVWHGIECWDADSRRQRQLERAGWVFHRIWASDFYRDPETAIRALTNVLDSLGIEPRGDQQLHATPPPPSEEASVVQDLDVEIMANVPESPPEPLGPAELVDFEPPSPPTDAVSPHEEWTQPLAGDTSHDTEVDGAVSRPPLSGGSLSGPSRTPSDQDLLTQFEVVSAAEWADLAQWARVLSHWDATQRNVVRRVAKKVAARGSLPVSERLWAARLHRLACRLGFHPHPPGEDRSDGLGQAGLPFGEGTKPN